MTGWSTAPLGELASKARYSCVGGPFGSELTTRDYVDDGVPVIRGSNLGADGFIDDGFVYISEPKADSLQGNLAFPGDVVFTQRGTIGQVALIPMSAHHSRYVLSQSQMKVSLDLARVEGRYLVEWFRSPDARRHLAQHTLATGVPHINLGILKRVPVPLPSLGEQRRIADMLDKADAIRRKRKQAIALTNALLRSTFLDMFGDPVTNPKGWPVVSLACQADVRSGVAKGKRYDGQGLVSRPYMRVANVQDGYLILDEVKHIEVTAQESESYRLQVGDVLLTEGGDPDKLGRGAVWRGEVDECIHQNHVFRVRVGASAIPDFVSSQLGSDRGKRYFLRAAKQTTGIASINMGQLRAFPLLLPPVSLQKAFASAAAQARAIAACMHRAQSAEDELFSSVSRTVFAA